MAKTIIVVVVSAVVACFIGASVVNGGELCSIAASTTKIIHRLCHVNGGANQKNVTMINDFFGCYDHAPGKAQFEKCQVVAFGAVLNTPEGVAASCASRLNLLKYLPCLTREFKNAGLNMNAAVLQINACQSKVLGISSSRLGCNL